jgi:hypothetical protein
MVEENNGQANAAAPPKKKRSRRRQRSTADSTGTFWGSDTRELLKAGQITPVIGDAISTGLIFPDFSRVLKSWAEKVEYPITEPLVPARIAQYVRLKEGSSGARASYLYALKEGLIDKAQEDPAISQKRFDTVDSNFENLTFTQMAADLGYLELAEQPDHPLNILAGLPLPIYVTTSYHGFLEMALRERDRTPETELYYWHPGLEGPVESVFKREPEFVPTEKRPLVYHLFGHDDYHDSLVLSENDHLDYLMKVAQDQSRERKAGDIQGLPSHIDTAFSTSSLLLMGYSLADWDFRILFRGLVSNGNNEVRKPGLSIQVEDDRLYSQETVRAFVEEYLWGVSTLKIFWGNPQDCLRSLNDIWKGRA